MNPIKSIKDHCVRIYNYVNYGNYKTDEDFLEEIKKGTEKVKECQLIDTYIINHFAQYVKDTDMNCIRLSLDESINSYKAKGEKFVLDPLRKRVIALRAQNMQAPKYIPKDEIGDTIKGDDMSKAWNILNKYSKK